VPTKLKLLNFAHLFADCRVQILAKMKTWNSPTYKQQQQN
jgi:hypothetical protein